MYAVIRIKGPVGIRKEINDTLTMLRLHRVNHCVIVPEKPEIEGMIRKAQQCLTWGEIKPEVLEKLVYERGRLVGNKKIDKKDSKKILDEIKKNESLKDIETFKPVFRLSPPVKGYKSIKKPFPKGSQGYRGDKINELIERMI